MEKRMLHKEERFYLRGFSSMKVSSKSKTRCHPFNQKDKGLI